jgi:hypothetical protein
MATRRAESDKMTLWEFMCQSSYVVSGAVDPQAELASRLLLLMCKWHFLPVEMQKEKYDEIARAAKKYPNILNRWAADDWHTEEVAKNLRIVKSTLEQFLDEQQFNPAVVLKPNKKGRLWFEKWTVAQ